MLFSLCCTLNCQDLCNENTKINAFLCKNRNREMTQNFQNPHQTRAVTTLQAGQHILVNGALMQVTEFSAYPREGRHLRGETRWPQLKQTTRHHTAKKHKYRNGKELFISDIQWQSMALSYNGMQASSAIQSLRQSWQQSTKETENNLLPSSVTRWHQYPMCPQVYYTDRKVTCMWKCFSS